MWGRKHRPGKVIPEKGTGHSPHRPIVSDAGETVLELVLMLSVFGILTAMALALVLQTYRGLQLRLRSSSLFASGTTAITQMTKELRMAGYPSAKVFSASAATNSPGLVATPFVTVTSYDLVFQADSNLAGNVEQIEYVLASGSENLYRKSTLKNLNGTLASSTETTLLVNGVQNQIQGRPLFTSGVDPASPQPFPLNVRVVYINLVLQSLGKENSAPVSVILTATCPRMNF
jgi:type II secretory pathway component PulJ